MTPLLIALSALLSAVLAVLLLPLWRGGAHRQAALYGVMVAAASLGLYALFGSPRVVPLADAHRAELAALREQIKVTSAIIKENPKNLDAWLTLAQALQDSGDYPAAVNGFKTAVLISKGHPRIIMAYAEAMILEANGTVTDAAKKSIDIALMIDPNLPIARYYKAVWLLQNDQQPEAMQMMKTLYKELPDDSKLKQRMKREIGR